jgi:hypothetical protein
VGQLLEAIADPANLAAAWTKVRANAGAAGVDGQSIAAFEADLRVQLAALRQRLCSAKRYVPPPVRRVEIPKPDGRVRPLGVPTVADRVVQQATVAVIGPFFESRFLACSFGFRPGRSATQAVGWVREAIRRGDRWVAEFDIVGFFDNLNHARLLREVAKVIDDPEVIGLIRRWLKAGVLVDGRVRRRDTGTPQGGVILRIDRYEHGVRSMETIVATSLLTGKRLFERSALQAHDQLDGHVDGHRFVALMQEAELEGELLERLAGAAHDVFCAGKRRDGFTLGPRDATKKTHPLLVPYAELPELYKESNRTTVRNIPKKLARAGYIMIQAREGDPRFNFSPQEVEELAEYEHELWMEAHLAEGWTLGTATPENPKRNEYLVEWDALPDDIKTIDRDLVEGIPDILAAAGYTAIKIGSS